MIGVTQSRDQRLADFSEKSQNKRQKFRVSRLVDWNLPIKKPEIEVIM